MQNNIRNFIKSNLLNLVYTSAKIEGLTTNRLDTDAIIKGIGSNASKKDIVVIRNLRDAYLFISETFESAYDRGYLLQLHRIIANNLIFNPGYYRTFEVTIGGSSYKPGMIYEHEANEFIDNLIRSAYNIEGILNLGIELMRKQLFEDVNKRTAFAIMNALLINKKYGLLILKEDITDKMFKDLLIKFYEKYDEESRSSIIKFLKSEYLITPVIKNHSEFKGGLILVDNKIMKKLYNQSNIAYCISDNLLYDTNSNEVIGFLK